MKKDYPEILKIEGENWQDPDPQTGKLGTIVPAEWLQGIEDGNKSIILEVLSVLAEANIKPNELVNTQLRDAVIKIVTDRLKWVNIQGAPQVLDSLGDSKKDAASQRIVNVVNTLAKNAMTAANNANDKANQAKQEAYEAKQLADSKMLPFNGWIGDVHLNTIQDIGKYAVSSSRFMTSGNGYPDFNYGGTVIVTVERWANDVLLQTIKTEEVIFSRRYRLSTPEIVKWEKVGSKDFMSVGDFGFGGTSMPITREDEKIDRNGLYRIFYNSGSFHYGSALNMQYSEGVGTLFGVKSVSAKIPAFIADHYNSRGAEKVTIEFYTTGNATTSKDGFLRSFGNKEVVTTDMIDGLFDVPVSQIFYFDTPTPPAGYIARNGQTIDKAKMPKLYAQYGAKMPDDRDRVHRMTGTLAGAVGTTQEDAIRNIIGSFVADNELGNNTADAFYQIERLNWGGNPNDNQGSRVGFDASRVVPTASENRVKSRIIIACNKIQ